MVLRQPDGGVRPGTRVHRVRRTGNELDVEQTAIAAMNADLRPVSHRPFGAQVEGRAPAALVDRQELYPDFHVASRAIRSHGALACPFRTARSSLDGGPGAPPAMRDQRAWSASGGGSVLAAGMPRTKAM